MNHCGSRRPKNRLALSGTGGQLPRDSDPPRERLLSNDLSARSRYTHSTAPKRHRHRKVSHVQYFKFPTMRACQANHPPKSSAKPGKTGRALEDSGKLVVNGEFEPCANW